MSDITERVERGAALLDEKRPGWWQGIDLDRLDIGSPCNCVAGQLGTGEDPYSLTVSALGIWGADEECEHGFEAPFAMITSDREYGPLTEAWRDLITRRREMASVPA
jgi:hypothetical protein